MAKRIPDPKQVSELFNILSEENAEVIQVISKINRFGLYSVHPDKPDVTNLDHLEEEIGDALAIVDMLTNAGYLSKAALAAAAQRKKDKLRKWSNITVEDFE